MQQNTTGAISHNDDQLIEANHLGEPLATYRYKLGYIRLMRSLGLLGLLVSSILFTIAVLELAYINARNSVSLAFVPIGLSSILVAFLILFLVVPQEQSDRIIVCEQGLLHIKKKIKTERVICMYWNDIVVIREGVTGLDYFLRNREGQVLTLSIAYQDFAELIAQIKQRSQEYDNNAGPLEGYRLNREHLLPRAIEAVKGGKFSRIVFYGGIGLVILFGFLWVITGRTLFAGLMFGVGVLTPVVMYSVSFWRIWKIVTQIKANTPEE